MSYNEKPREIAKNTLESGLIHQPVVLVIDTSGSMSDLIEDGSCTKLEAIERLIDSLADVPLSNAEKAAVDICILSFDDEVRTVQDWQPLSKFQGVCFGKPDGCTCLGSAVIEGMRACKARRKAYEVQGIQSRRPQVFVYTDAHSTEDMDECEKLVAPYLNKACPSAKLNAILVPPCSSSKSFDGLGKAVAVLQAKNCVNGLPASFKLLVDSIVTFSQTAFGEIAITALPSGEGLRFKKGQGGIEVDDETGAVVMVEQVDCDAVWGEI